MTNHSTPTATVHDFIGQDEDAIAAALVSIVRQPGTHIVRHEGTGRSTQRGLRLANRARRLSRKSVHTTASVRNNSGHILINVFVRG